MKLDIKEIKSKHSIVSVISRYVDLSPKNGGQIGLCPFHNEKNPSFNVSESKGIFKCFGCGESGDVIDFVAKIHNTDLPGAVKILDGQPVEANFPKQQGKKRIQWTPIVPPKNVISPNFEHYEFGKPSKIYKYHTVEGSILGYACRFDHTNGTKDVLPRSYCKNEMGQSEWRWSGMPLPRTLYNAHLITQFPEKTIIVVEGEKCADVITKILPKAIGTCWPGGSHSIKHADWSLLKNRNIFIWPDNDTDQKDNNGNIKPWHRQPGNEAMLSVSTLIESNNIRWIHVKNKPHKWDVADEDWSEETLKKFILDHIGDVPDVNIEPIEDAEIIDVADQYMEASKTVQTVREVDKQAHTQPVQTLEPVFAPPTEQAPAYNNSTEYFKFLGYEYVNNEHYHVIFSLRSKSLHHYKATSLTKNNLLMLAPHSWWEMKFPKKNSFDIDSAIDYIISRSLQSGIFDPNCVRGRGAWVEEDSVIVNTGNYLIVNGKRIDISDYNSDYIYNSGPSIKFETSLPATKLESAEFINMLKLVNWERDVSAYLLAGWCILAPVCGALDWRPHIWITGSAGTGKSWLFQKIIRRMIGKIAISVQSETSEAGIRQALQHDARPVIFDEAEGEDRKAQERMQSVLNLMRSASTSDGGQIIKGSAGGIATSYTIKSCFAYASIGVMLFQQSDRSRVTVMGIEKDETSNWKQKWEDLQAKYNQIVTDDFVIKMRTRTLKMLPVILRNAQTFSNAAAAYLGDQRSGDQIGVMLAGAYSLVSDNVIDYQTAYDWVAAKDWSEEKNAKQTRDENNLLSLLIDSIVKIETQYGVKERTVGELIEIACLNKSDEVLMQQSCEERLRRIGFKIDGTYLVVSNQSPFILDILKETPWRRNHSRMLARLTGAVPLSSTTFSSSLKTRAVAIPLEVIFNKQMGMVKQGDIPF